MAVNPYKALPIYGPEAMQYYKQSNRRTHPPHIFAIADGAYQALLETRQNQSILITGESGAGKTENTKRVIQYLASISASGDASSLEEKIIQANPIMEAFGNAQTIRNNNSSRFGKFIKIEFGPAGAIVGAHIERYLLEKSRVTNRSVKERNFHVFYQFLSGAPAELRTRLGITGGPEDYAYTRSSNKTVDGVNDKAEFSSLIVSLPS